MKLLNLRARHKFNLLPQSFRARRSTILRKYSRFSRAGAMSNETIQQIVEGYEGRRHEYREARKKCKSERLILHHLSFNCIRTYALRLLPHNRDVILCFEHFKYDAICNVDEVKKQRGQNAKPPDHLIILQLKFLQMNTFLNLGTLGYMDFTDRSIVAECIKEYIEDCFRADVRVIASCSSGQLEMMTILAELPIKNYKNGDLLSYSVRGRGRVMHIFDSPWMLRTLKAMFYTHDVMFNHSGKPYIASYDNVSALLSLPRLQGLLTSEVYDNTSKSTRSAAQTFSKTVSYLLEGFYDPYDKTDPKYPEAKGTKVFVQIMDQLFDSFNSTSAPQTKPKPFRQPLSLHSDHWTLWDDFTPILDSMRFALRSVSLLPDPLDKTEGESEEILGIAQETVDVLQEPVNGNDEDPQFIIKAPEGADRCKVYLASTEDTVECVSDDEYKPCEGDNNRMVHMLQKLLIDVKTGKPASSNGKDVDQKSRYRQETLTKELENLVHCMKLIKGVSIYAKTISNIETLLIAIAENNAELRESRASNITYEYVSWKFSRHLKKLSFLYEDTYDYYNLFQTELGKILDVMRFLNMSLFQCWMASIAGMRLIFAELNKRHCDAFNTRMVNCDLIHTYVEILRDYNGLFPRKIVDRKVYGEDRKSVV